MPAYARARPAIRSRGAARLRVDRRRRCGTRAARRMRRHRLHRRPAGRRRPRHVARSGPRDAGPGALRRALPCGACGQRARPARIGAARPGRPARRDLGRRGPPARGSGGRLGAAARDADRRRRRAHRRCPRRCRPRRGGQGAAGRDERRAASPGRARSASGSCGAGSSAPSATGPRTLRRVLRFQRFLAAARTAEPGSLARLAADAGYADQAHLARDCRRLAGLTPSALLAEGAGPAGERPARDVRFVQDRRALASATLPA